VRGRRWRPQMAGTEEDRARTVAFVGLGAMGWGMAANLASAAAGNKSRSIISAPVLVYNRTAARAQRHAAEHGGDGGAEAGVRAVTSLSELAAADVIFSCLPTSEQVADVAEEASAHLRRGAIWVDCTSGDPRRTREIGAGALARAGVSMVDCPVSGGPAGAASGQLTAMIGSDDAEALLVAAPLVALFAHKAVVRTGPLGSGHAVKAINNALNVAHLAIASEGLLALAAMGVPPTIALAAINGSSGRSLQTQERLPKEVLTRRFGYGRWRRCGSLVAAACP
jgi:3-hydroxyisobutyrate dehydrogenase